MWRTAAMSASLAIALRHGNSPRICLVSNRTAAMAIGVERVVKTKQMRGLFP